ncbi:MAG TPA: hypothetical protein VGQ83_23875 [Polyangia bacterium]
MQSSNILALLSCPSCGAAMRLNPPSTPGRSWLAVVPCKSCRSYGAYMVTDGGAARSWVLRRSILDPPVMR